MKRLSPAIIIVLTSILAILVSCAIDEQPGLDQSIPTEEAAEYHYTGKYCTDCHEQIPKEGGNKFLKYDGDFNILCKCHLKEPGNYIHPVDIVPSVEKKTKLPAEMPLQEGKISCLTCHDIYWQCQKRTVDKISLRGAPYPKRSDFCYQCHDETSYMMLDPHVQLNAWGKIIDERCLYCHTEKPDEKRANYEDVQFIGNLEVICQRCHVIRGNHAGNVNHLVKPSAKALARMQAMEKEFGIILPLDADGKLTCITCHNPHDKGVIPAERPAAKGAGSKYRHRLPDRLCVECHKV
jgi:hypothetical protein